MAAYQAQAVESHVTPLAGMRPAAGLTDLPAADGYVASAAHPGRPDVLTNWMDAAVVDENDPIATDPDLDLFDERNGPPYSADFLARYRSAQVARNNTITDWVERELKRVRAAGFSDRPFTVMRTWADPRMVEQEGALETAKAGVPAQESNAAGGQVIGEVVLGEVDLVVRSDYRHLRFAPDAPVIQALTRVPTRAGAPSGRRRQPDEFTNDPRRGGASQLSGPPCCKSHGRKCWLTC